MTIEADFTVFPNNIVNLIYTRVPEVIDPDLYVVRRALRRGDPPQSVGITAAQWLPQDFEMVGQTPEPTIQRYTFAIQGYIFTPDEENGIAQHAVLSRAIRNMLYRDGGFRSGLTAMVSTDAGTNVTESVQRWGIRQVQFISTEINQAFLYLSTTEFWVETQLSF